MRFKGLDLNLVLALDTLLDERSVSKAANRLNLSQPAVSAALARLRIYFSDELLVPAGRRMIPTPLAEDLRPMARQLMEQASLFAATSSSFDPLTSKRRIGIGTSDYIITVLIAPLLEYLQRHAPGMRVDIFPTGPDILERLNRGEIDLVIGPEPFLTPTAPKDWLFDERHVVVGWDQNPAMHQSLSLEDFLSLGQVAVRIGIERDLSFAERYLENYRDKRKIEVTTTQFSSVPWMVVGTTRVGIIQERLAKAYLTRLPLMVQPVPFEMPLLKELIQYHPSRVNDAGLRWLIQAMGAVIGDGGTAAGGK
jgi:LysR family transcriptional regulator, nod-box dependent transcriptional activator